MKKCCNRSLCWWKPDRPKSSPRTVAVISLVAQYVSVLIIFFISAVITLLKWVGDVSPPVIRSTTNIIPARSNLQRFISSLSFSVWRMFLLPLCSAPLSLCWLVYVMSGFILASFYTLHTIVNYNCAGKCWTAWIVHKSLFKFVSISCCLKPRKIALRWQLPATFLTFPIHGLMLWVSQHRLISVWRLLTANLVQMGSNLAF